MRVTVCMNVGVYIYIYIYIYICIQNTCMHVRICVRACIQKKIHACMSTYIDIYEESHAYKTHSFLRYASIYVCMYVRMSFCKFCSCTACNFSAFTNAYI
jgi:hypothetical protein